MAQSANQKLRFAAATLAVITARWSDVRIAASERRDRRRSLRLTGLRVAWSWSRTSAETLCRGSRIGGWAGLPERVPLSLMGRW